MSLRAAFEYIDESGRGYINKADVRHLIKLYADSLSAATVDQRSQPESLEMEALFRRFNHDKQNGIITLPEWIDQLTPKSKMATFAG
jgi:Ca2+-binding EF-hand superfamily protein